MAKWTTNVKNTTTGTTLARHKFPLERRSSVPKAVRICQECRQSGGRESDVTDRGAQPGRRAQVQGRSATLEFPPKLARPVTVWAICGGGGVPARPRAPPLPNTINMTRR